MARAGGAKAAKSEMPRGKRVRFQDLPPDVQRASKAIGELWKQEEERQARERVDFGELTAEAVTVGAITIPIPSALADDIIKNHLPQIDAKKVKSPSQFTRESWRRIAVMWWVLDHQYERDENGRKRILRFKREPDWMPPEDELDDYLGELDYGPRAADFFAAYRTATSISASEDRQKKVDAARRTGKPQRIEVERPYLSPSGTSK